MTDNVRRRRRLALRAGVWWPNWQVGVVIRSSSWHYATLYLGPIYFSVLRGG